MKSLNKYADRIHSISDERGNGDGIWVYLKKEWADFDHDPYWPTRQVHESSVTKLLTRFQKDRIRKITDTDLNKFEHLNN